jgi:hypothetical protein
VWECTVQIGLLECAQVCMGMPYGNVLKLMRELAETHVGMCRGERGNAQWEYFEAHEGSSCRNMGMSCRNVQKLMRELHVGLSRSLFRNVKMAFGKGKWEWNEGMACGNVQMFMWECHVGMCRSSCGRV